MVKHVRDHNRDPLEVFVVVSDGSEGRGDPLGIVSTHKHRILKLCGFREVDRARWKVYKLE